MKTLASTSLMGAVAAAVVGGCKVGPDYRTPTSTLPANFATTQPATTRPAVAVDLARWWESFNDPHLNRLVDLAIRNNFDIRIAQARVRQSRAQLDSAYGGIFPSIDGSASFSRSRTSRNALAGVQTGTGAGTGTGTGSGSGSTGSGSSSATNFDRGTTNLYQGGFDATWELDVFGGQRRTVEAAVATLESDIEDRRNTLVTLLSEVAQNYILLRGYQYQLSIVDNNVRVQQDTLQVQRQKLAAGIANDLTVAQAESLLASTRAQRPPLEMDIEQTIHRLGILMGQEPTSLEAELVTAVPLPVGPPTIPTDVPSDLLRRRPDIRQAERLLAAATANIGVATAELFPKFSLTGSAGLSSAKFSSWGNHDSFFWSAGPNVTWRLFDAGQIRADIRYNEALTESALLTYRQTVFQALADVEDALSAYKHEHERMLALRDSVDANRRAVDLSLKLNKAGVVDFLNVLTAEQDLSNAEDQLAISQQTVSTNLVAIYKALGGGWETTELTPTTVDPAALHAGD